MERRYNEQRSDQYNIASKEKLSKVLKKKIETTMIGALSSLEENFKFLWENGNSTESQEMYNIYQSIRSEILDKGNRQIRNVDSELSNYTVTLNKHKYYFPVLKGGRDG